MNPDGTDRDLLHTADTDTSELDAGSQCVPIALHGIEKRQGKIASPFETRGILGRQTEIIQI